MIVDVVIAVTGIAVLLLLTFGGLVAAQGRRSEELLIAPRGAGFGDASRLIRRAEREKRRAHAGADVEATVIVRMETPFARSDRHAA